MNFIVFTDGASIGNPGPGGFGAIVVGQENEEVAELGGREEMTTNNRMELMAVIAALSYVTKNYTLDPKPYSLQIYTDSKYVLRGYTEWMRGWLERGWKTTSKKPVQNADLWKELNRLSEKLEIEWRLLPGHAGVPGNVRADEIATTYAGGEEPGLYHGPLIEYPVDVLNITVDDELKIARDEKKARQRSDAYSYLSVVDGVVKRHESWKETEKRVSGVPGAKFKKSISPEDEVKILKEWGYSADDISE